MDGQWEVHVHVHVMLHKWGLGLEWGKESKGDWTEKDCKWSP